jgi:hypothetical protein
MEPAALTAGSVGRATAPTAKFSGQTARPRNHPPAMTGHRLRHGTYSSAAGWSVETGGRANARQHAGGPRESEVALGKPVFFGAVRCEMRAFAPEP